MTNRKLQISGSLMLATFLGCSTGVVLVSDGIAPQQAIAQDVDDSYFYENLAPHGQWFFQAQLGWVWHPARVNVGWRPYTEGQWVWANDVGWTWASQEPWGWATYHYGRWYFDPMFGWSWVPGRVWAPAWVSWRVEAGYIGWAPMWPVYFDNHPDYRWDRWNHDSEWDRRHHGRDWDRWVFTRDRDFTSERVGRRSISDHRERERIYSQSQDVTRFDENQPGRNGHSIDKARVEKAVGHEVRSVRIENADKPGRRDGSHPDRLEVFRPRVKETKGKTPDRLGLAKEPSPEARGGDTLREEKTRLEKAPHKDKRRDGVAAEQAQPSEEKAKPRAERPTDRKPDPRAERPTDRKPDPRAERPTDRKPDPRAERPTDRKPDPRAERPSDRKPDPRAEKPSRQHEPAPQMQPQMQPQSKQQKERQQPRQVEQPSQPDRRREQPQKAHQQPMQSAPSPKAKHNDRQDPSAGEARPSKPEPQARPPHGGQPQQNKGGAEAQPQPNGKSKADRKQPQPQDEGASAPEEKQ